MGKKQTRNDLKSQVVLIDGSVGDQYLIEKMLAYNDLVQFDLKCFESVDDFLDKFSQLQESLVSCVLVDFLGESSAMHHTMSAITNKLPNVPVIAISEFFNLEAVTSLGELGVLSIIEKKNLSESNFINTVVHNDALFKTMKHKFVSGYYDYLTGLVNRNLFHERVEHAIALSRRNNKVTALLLVDIDDFKTINDRFGHDTGDVFLKVIAGRLKDSVRSSDTVARIGGDEFAILLEDLSYPEQTVQKVKEILSTTNDPISIKGNKLTPSLSIGLSIMHGKSAVRFTYDWLFQSADTALYRAKEKGKNTYSVFTEKDDTEMIHALAVEDELTTAIKKKNFCLYYQPIFDAKTDMIAGAEALLRWRTNDGKILAPGSFLSVVEKLGMMKELGDLVIETAIADIAQWYKYDQTDMVVHINVAPEQFITPGFYEHLKSHIEKHNVSPRMIELELTEQNLFENSKYIEREFVKLDWLGVRLAIDDFGTGYNSYEYLRRFEFHTLKLDKSFVQSMFDSKVDMAIIQSITKFAQSLNINVIAEGVETKQQLQFLVDIGVDQIQGYYKSKPISLDDFMSKYMHIPQKKPYQKLRVIK